MFTIHAITGVFILNQKRNAHFFSSHVVLNILAMVNRISIKSQIHLVSNPPFRFPYRLWLCEAFWLSLRNAKKDADEKQFFVLGHWIKSQM